MSRSTHCFLLALALALSAPMAAVAQETPPPAAEDMIVKVYPVGDLVAPIPNYAYTGSYLPGVRPQGNSGMGGGLGGVMGGMGGGTGGMGGGMGGMGGGMFNVGDQSGRQLPTPSGSPSNPRSGMDGLIEAITTVIDPESWDEMGGPATASPIGTNLAVRQTPARQAKVLDFLEQLRANSSAKEMFSIEARWLALTLENLAALQAAPAGKNAAVRAGVDRAALGGIPKEAALHQGQIVTFNGQTVHLISGRLQYSVTGAIPVVGGTSKTGYQPLMQAPHLGVFAQFTPLATKGEEGILLDVHSSITHWNPDQETVAIGRGESGGSDIEIDRVSAIAQQFATSLRLPLNQPVLVGGVSVDAELKEELPDDVVGLYLIVEVLPQR